MDNATTKLLLGAYRAGTQDKDDPFFAEALREIEHDPKLAAWFEEEQRFDSLMVKTLKQAQAPAGLKELILLSAKSPAKPPTLIETLPHFWKRQTTTLAGGGGGHCARLRARPPDDAEVNIAGTQQRSRQCGR